MLAPGGEIEEPSRFAELCLESRGLYRRYIEQLSNETNLSIEYRECGALDLAYSAESWQALKERATHQAALGIEAASSHPIVFARFRLTSARKIWREHYFSRMMPSSTLAR